MRQALRTGRLGLCSNPTSQLAGSEAGGSTAQCVLVNHMNPASLEPNTQLLEFRITYVMIESAPWLLRPNAGTTDRCARRCPTLRKAELLIESSSTAILTEQRFPSVQALTTFNNLDVFSGSTSSLNLRSLNKRKITAALSSRTFGCVDRQSRVM